MGSAALGLPLAAVHLDESHNQTQTYKWRLVLSYDGTRFSGQWLSSLVTCIFF